MTIAYNVTVSGSGASSPWVVMNQYKAPFNVAVAVEVTGTARYTVQHTFVDVGVLGTAAVAAGSIFSHDTLVSATASDDGNYAFPVKAIRVTLVCASAAGDQVTMRVLQAGY